RVTESHLSAALRLLRQIVASRSGNGFLRLTGIQCQRPFRKRRDYSCLRPDHFWSAPAQARGSTARSVPLRKDAINPDLPRSRIHHAPVPQLKPAALQERGLSLIRFIFFFHRLGASDFGLRAALPLVARRLPLVNFLKDVCDHRRGGGATVNFAANVAFVQRGEGVSR